MIASLTPEQREAFLKHWPNWRREDQCLPSALDWYIWLILAGRGWGKTKTGAEAVRELVDSGKYPRFALIGQTVADVRDVMIQGESGLLSCYTKGDRPVYVKSERIVKFANGAIASTYSGDEPDQLRGPQHHGAWADELAKWKYPKLAWDNLEMGLRLGEHPVIIATTTPRPIPIIRELVKDDDVTVTTGSTFANIDNLAPTFKRRLMKKYDGTRIGRQELNAEILDDNPNALWSASLLEKQRINDPKDIPPMAFIVVGVDPQGVKAEDAGDDDQAENETGIVAVGVGPCNQRCRNPDLCTGHLYVVADDSTNGTPGEWGMAVVRSVAMNSADRATAEINNGGEMVRHVINGCDPNTPTKTVRATRGKHTRAEPIANLYTQGRAHHCGQFAKLEDEMTTWQPGMRSPNRMDALVWAATDLFFDGDDSGQDEIVEYYQPVVISPI